MASPDRARDALFTLVDRIYVINLAERTDRYRAMAGELARLGLGFDDARVTHVAAHVPPGPGAFPSAGVRGCFESHLSVLRDIDARGLRAALVLEDDTQLSRHAVARLPGLVAAARSRDWAMIYGWSPDAPIRRDSRQDHALRVLPPETGVQMTHFYAISGAAAALAGPYLSAMAARKEGDPAGGPMDVDGAYCWFRAAHPDLVTLAPVTPLAMQRPSRSDIHPGSWLKSHPWMAPVLNGVRRVRVALTR